MITQNKALTAQQIIDLNKSYTFFSWSVRSAINPIPMVRAEGIYFWDTEYKGFLPYDTMLQEIMKAYYLFVCATEPRHVPGKLFEYLRAGNPIIAFGDGNEEVKKIITDANAGLMFGYNDGAESFFREHNSFITNQEVVKNFERRKIAEELNSILNKTAV